MHPRPQVKAMRPYQDDRLRDPQMIRLTFAYRFGKVDMNLFKRKNLKSMGEGMQGATDGMQQ